ncbi:hypothetical protein [Mycobacterium interjectum]|uniref:hypothetical protein n=1 Tax=Mycobacterium interjectum TaxID=33895 RepID=UPI0021F3B136|nr:hypothetical protein [Mycobacterium interjectum]
MTSTRSRKARLLLPLLAAGVVPAVALLGPLVTAPTAQADGTDDAFIAALHAHGIAHDSPKSAIAPAIWSATSSTWARRRNRSRRT